MSTENQAERAEQTAPMTSQGAARRRLAKTGLGAAGVLWTTQASATRLCVSASAALSSGLHSKEPKYTKARCEGKGPDYWKHRVSSKTRFHEIFPCSDHYYGTYGTVTLQALLKGCSFDQSEIGKYLVVTYLNIKQGWISYISERTLFEIWSQLQRTGHYQPAKGHYWDARMTAKYLWATQI